ncbi:MAG: hypothetical protein MUP82_06250, partial [Candidatus Marinimicrobia bacterium]|nr:hypothetical protein [Candidatus Neomarinimicrobiota bacterium]
LQRLIADLKKLDVCFIRHLVNNEELLKKTLNEIIEVGEIKMNEEIIVPNRGKQKTPQNSVENQSGEVKPRRISFSNTKFFDGDTFLEVINVSAGYFDWPFDIAITKKKLLI